MSRTFPLPAPFLIGDTSFVYLTTITDSFLSLDRGKAMLVCDTAQEKECWAELASQDNVVASVYIKDRGWCYFTLKENGAADNPPQRYVQKVGDNAYIQVPLMRDVTDAITRLSKLRLLLC